MKKLKFLILVGMALVLMGMTACASFPKLDISTLDHSQPVEVAGISLYIYTWTENFYETYGADLRNPSSDLPDAAKDKLLQILCGTVAENWEFITQRVKAETGLTLDGDKLLETWENRDSTHISSQKLPKSLGKDTGYFYSWDHPVEFTDKFPPVAMIQLVFYGSTSGLGLHSVIIETKDVDELMEMDKKSLRQAVISLQ
jgi:hypothetical protein